MARKHLLALCLLVVLPILVNAESDADAESDAFYHRYRGYHAGAAVLRSYPAYRRAYYSPYAYRSHPYGPFHAPARRYSYKLLGPSPARVTQPIAVPQGVFEHRIAEPAYQPAPVAHLQPVPAVPTAPIETYENAAIYEEPAEVAPIPAPTPVYTPVEAPLPPAAPAVIETAAGPISTQFHAQDEFGNVAYGYNNPNSAKEERRDAYGNVVGSYSYVDATGIPKHLSYVADDFGFRVTGTNLHVPPTPLH